MSQLWTLYLYINYQRHNRQDEGEKHIAKQIDLIGNTVQKYDIPIAAISQNEKNGLSHSFIRLKKAAPAYGYANGEDVTTEENCPENPGIHGASCLKSPPVWLKDRE